MTLIPSRLLSSPPPHQFVEESPLLRWGRKIYDTMGEGEGRLETEWMRRLVAKAGDLWEIVHGTARGNHQIHFLFFVSVDRKRQENYLLKNPLNILTLYQCEYSATCSSCFPEPHLLVASSIVMQVTLPVLFPPPAGSYLPLYLSPGRPSWLICCPNKAANISGVSCEIAATIVNGFRPRGKLEGRRQAATTSW